MENLLKKLTERLNELKLVPAVVNTSAIYMGVCSSGCAASCSGCRGCGSGCSSVSPCSRR